MVTGATISRDLAREVLADPDFVEPAIILRATEGHRNQYGEFVRGAEVATSTSLVSAPMTGQERMVLPEGLRDEDVRKFWIMGDGKALHYGLADGDRFILGMLGRTQNVFSDSTLTDVESVRDAYGVANPTWLASYRSGFVNMILLRGFGMSIYQRYDAIDGHWANVDIYRAYRPQRWGGFTEITTIRQDPGNA